MCGVIAQLPQGEITLDLRQSTLGNYEEMRDCLEILAPSNDYGYIVRSQAGEHRKITVSNGTLTQRKFKIIVDNSTWGAAAVFASILVENGLAEIVDGSLSSDLSWVETIELPDGSGYTLKTGVYAPTDTEESN